MRKYYWYLAYQMIDDFYALGIEHGDVVERFYMKKLYGENCHAEAIYYSVRRRRLDWLPK